MTETYRERGEKGREEIGYGLGHAAHSNVALKSTECSCWRRHTYPCSNGICLMVNATAQ